MQVVNSSYYNVKTSSILKAIVFLGIKTIKCIIFANTVFFGGQRDDYLDFLWQHAENTNKFFVRIYKEFLNEEVDEDMMSVGLFHDIGKVVLIKEYGDLYDEVWRDFLADEKEGIEKFEKEKFGVDHQEIGFYFLNLWGFSDDIIEATRFHHNPLDDNIKRKKLVAVTHLANYYAKRKLGLDFSEKGLVEEIFELLGLDRESLDRKLLNE